MKTTMVGHQWNAAPMVGTPRYHASMEQKVEPLLHKRGGHLSRQQTTAAFLQGNPFRSHLKLSKRLSSRITRQQHMPLVSQCAICVCVYIYIYSFHSKFLWQKKGFYPTPGLLPRDFLIGRYMEIRLACSNTGQP